MANGQDTFRPGTKVLAYHGPLVYEAKVLKYHEKDALEVDLGEDGTEPLANNKIPGFLLDRNAHFLHYKGWNSKWDEWVSSERILEFNDDNLGLSRELRNARKKPIERLDSGITYRQTSVEPKPRKPKKEKAQSQAIEKEKTPSNGRKRQKLDVVGRYEIQLPLRPKIKSVLVDDWELITKDRKLVDLDTVVSISSILTAYYSAKLPVCDARTLASVRETIDGVQAYFDESLSLDLLYKFERLQYADMLKTNPYLRPCDVYGLEHLLRLLSTLPARLSQVVMDSASLGVLLAQVSSLMNFLDANLEKFGSSYITASPSYDRLAKG